MWSEGMVAARKVLPVATRLGRWGIALALVILSALPLEAQRDTGVVRRVSSRQRDIERLVQELLEQRKREQEFARLLSGLQFQVFRATSDSMRSNARAKFEIVATQMRDASSNQLRLRRDLESMCSDLPKPQGWLGVVTTGVSRLDRPGDGPEVVRFMEPPIIESVDPGSPADRVGVRTGDVLIEIGGQPVLRRDIVFAELLRPGERVEVKLQRGKRVITVTPTVVPMPDVMKRTPCSWVDASTAYVLAPSSDGRVVRVGGRANVLDARGQAPVGVFARGRDTTQTTSFSATVTPGGSYIFAGPMVELYARGNPVAGIQLAAVNSPGLSELVGVKNGLLVTEVLPGTIGAEAGLLAGDVLVEANETALLTPATLQRVISRASARTVTITLIRSVNNTKKRETVTLKW